ncbi:hypothetical protein [Methylobacterium planeticum]|uniref:hypothetical protein n=1 Tax=Methylobacterium planeticum TaxID=2615211 RepID=UPI001FEE871C|nr:hypothetical protein [Methylobacterium planeticum]
MGEPVIREKAPCPAAFAGATLSGLPAPCIIEANEPRHDPVRYAWAAPTADLGLGGLIMAPFTMALVFDAFAAPSAPSLNIAVFGTLARFEALSVYIAVLDGVSRKSRIGKARDRLERAAG